MKSEYRALMEAEICANGKLRDLAGRKNEMELEMAEINEASAYQERVLRETRQKWRKLNEVSLVRTQEWRSRC